VSVDAKISSSTTQAEDDDSPSEHNSAGKMARNGIATKPKTSTVAATEVDIDMELQKRCEGEGRGNEEEDVDREGNDGRWHGFICLWGPG